MVMPQQKAKDEISEYLVDIDHDEDVSRSQRFDGDLNPIIFEEL
jgi:hypothetical protein